MTETTEEHWAPQSESFNFIPFAADRAYREANRALLKRAFAYLPARFFHVDVATGTGLVPQEVSALCEEEGKCATVVGIDPDRFAIESARRHTRPGPSCSIEFVQGMAQDLARLLAGRIPREGVDYTSIHDALHEIRDDEDKRGVVAAMARILKPGAILTYNSAFTTVAMDEAPMDWGRLKAKAFAILGRKRDRQMPAFKVYTPEQYRQMITDAGLAVIYEARRVVMLSRAALEAIARYPAFVEGAFSDMVGTQQVSLEEKSRTILAAIDSLGIVAIPRVWHEIIAQRPAS